MKTISQVASDLYKFFTESDNKKTKAYDTKAEVLRIDGDTVWVKITGGIDETPVSRTNNANVGDQVMVRVSGGRAWILGNETSPATDDTQAFLATDMAMGADVAAKNAINSANSAQESANRAELEATRAKTSAEEASGAALIATASANSALVQLSVIEDVSGTLDWIKKHGSYVLTTDTTVQEGTIYFIYNSKTQDYEPIVSPDPTKNPSQEGWFVLDISDSQSEYIMAHLAVTSRGLWILPDGIGSATDPQYAPKYKALLSTDALYIYNSSGVQLGKFGIESIIGDPSGSHLFLNKNNLKMFDKSGACYMHFTDLCSDEGTLTIRKTATKASSDLIIDSSQYTISSIDLESAKAINGSKVLLLSDFGYYKYRTGPAYSPSDHGYKTSYYIRLYKNGIEIYLQAGDSIVINYTVDGEAYTYNTSGPLSETILYYTVIKSSSTAALPTVNITSVMINGEHADSSYFYNADSTDNYLKVRLTSSFADTGDVCAFEYDVYEEAKAFTLGTRRQDSVIGQFSYCLGKNLVVENPYEMAIGKYNRHQSTDLFSVSYGNESLNKTYFRVRNDGEVVVGLGYVDNEWYTVLTNAGFNPTRYGTGSESYVEISLRSVILNTAEFIVDSGSA